MLRAVPLLPLVVLLTACGGVGFFSGSDKDQRTPLEKAAQGGNAAEVHRLLASGADPNDTKGSWGAPPLASATYRNGNVEVIRALLAAGANPNGRAAEAKKCWASPVWIAASMGDVENTRALLDAGASLNPPRCQQGVIGWLKPPIIDLFVAHGRDLRAVDENGRNELHLALSPPVVAPLEGIEYLIRAGVPLNARDRFAKTPLAYWKEPRDYESRWLSIWLLEHLSGDSAFQHERESRANLSALLARSGAIQ